MFSSFGFDPFFSSSRPRLFHSPFSSSSSFFDDEEEFFSPSFLSFPSQRRIQTKRLNEGKDKKERKRLKNEEQKEQKEREEKEQEQEQQEPSNGLTTTNGNNEEDFGLSLFKNWNEWNKEGKAEAIELKVEEEKDEYRITASVPHFNKEQLKLELKDGLLTISGEMKEEKKGEHSYSSTSRFVSRSMRLAEKVKEEEVKAQYENGTLKIRLPKDENQKKEKREMIMIE